jgi:ribosomal protein L3 glutamine methyltransferase
MALKGEYKAAAARMRSMRDLVRFGVSRFNEAGLAYGHGTENGVDEAFYLVRHALHLAPDEVDGFLDARLTRSEVRAALELLQRRVEERRPAAYLTREAWIGPHRFYIDERALVPRSFIGHWLDSDLAPWIEQPGAIRDVLELGTGSGCLAVLLALALPNARVDAVDISTDALELARRNVGDYGLEARVRLLQSDLYDGLKRKRYDLIVANPPYVRASAMQSLPPEYRHEPAAALAAGPDGLQFVRRILTGARAHLKRKGLLVMEVGHARAAVEQAFPRTPFNWIDIDGVDDAVLLLAQAHLPALVERA